MKKPLYLFLALLLPGLIFVFLKFAGKNEFKVPVFHELGVESVPSGCALQYGSPYHLPDSLRSVLELNRDVNVVVFPAEHLDFHKLKSAIDDEFGAGAVGLTDVHSFTKDSIRLLNWKKCVFLLNDPSQSVLIDNEGKFRGYYDLRSREEVDRLRVELKILLKKF